MPATPSAREVPNAIWPLVFAIASVFGVAGSMSGTGNDVLDAVVVLGVLVGVVLSTRYSVRTWRKLNEHEFKLAHTPRLLMVALAVGINGFVCFLLVFPVILLLGVLITGKGMVG